MKIDTSTCSVMLKVVAGVETIDASKSNGGTDIWFCCSACPTVLWAFNIFLDFLQISLAGLKCKMYNPPAHSLAGWTGFLLLAQFSGND